MNRRNIIKAVGGIGAVGVMAGAGITTMTGGAAAEVNFTPETVEHTSVDGEVDAVLVDTDGKITWEGFDSGVSSIDVALSISSDGDEYEEVETANDIDLGDQQGAKQTNSEGVKFNLGQVDLTETNTFSDEDFSEDSDSETNSVEVYVRIDATLNTENEESRETSTSSSFTVDNTNKETDEDISADVDAAVSHSGDIRDKDGEDTGDDAYLEFDFSELSGGDGDVLMTLHLQNYVEDIDEEAPLNAPIAFDIDENGERDFQLIWYPGKEEGDFMYIDESDNSEEDVSDVNGVVGDTQSGATVDWEVSASILGVSESGDSFRAGGNASAGGQDGSVEFCDDQSENPFKPVNMITITVP